MRIDWALPCRYVELADNGTTSTIVGAPIDAFWVRDLPDQVGLMVAMRVAALADEWAEQHELEVRLVKPDRSEEEKLRAPFGPMPDPPPLAQPGLETGLLVPAAFTWEADDYWPTQSERVRVGQALGRLERDGRVLDMTRRGMRAGRCGRWPTMPSACITKRKTASGPRFVVRYRLGGAAYPLVHGGSFKTTKEAKTRLDLVRGELAAGRNPGDVLRAPVAPVARTFAQIAEAYQSSRVDITEATREAIGFHLKAMAVFDDRNPATITWGDVQEWVGGLTLKPSSVRGYIATLRRVLDFAGVDPNPARDTRVKLPRREQTVVDPPTATEVETIIATVPKRYRLPLRVLEQTGMRIGEAHALEWQDVDEAGNRFRIRNGKTASARRWVQVPDWLMLEVAATVAREDRTAERRVFPGFNPDTAKNAMARACKTAGIVHRHPHDLRHRYASVKIAEGVPVTTVAAQLGHSRKSLTLDVYSHVLLGG